MIAWELANEIEKLSYKISGISKIIELCAERIKEDTESGALWAASEYLEILSEKAEELCNFAMNVHRQSANIELENQLINEDVIEEPVKRKPGRPRKS